MVKGETRIELSLVLGVLLCPVLSGIAFADETGAPAKEDMLAATASPASSHKQEILRNPGFEKGAAHWNKAG